METQLTCAAIIQRSRQHGTQLLLKRSAGRDGELFLVSGQVKDNNGHSETSTEALCRVLKETLGADGMRFDEGTVIVVEDLCFSENTRYIHCCYILDVDDVVNAKPEEYPELVWMTAESIPANAFFYPHYQIVKCHMEGKTFAIVRR